MKQFDFGQNWSDFSANAATVERVAQARAHFSELLSGIDIQGKSFLDIGFGQGFSLLSARAGGAVAVGCDINPKMVEWCREHLTFAEVGVNELSPPLPYADSSFELVYAFSVMTHLSEELQQEWVAECRRVLRPGGLFLFSTLGEYFVSRDRLTPAERSSFEEGKLVALGVSRHHRQVGATGSLPGCAGGG